MTPSEDALRLAKMNAACFMLGIALYGDDLTKPFIKYPFAKKANDFFQNLYPIGSDGKLREMYL